VKGGDGREQPWALLCVPSPFTFGIHLFFSFNPPKKKPREAEKEGSDDADTHTHAKANAEYSSVHGALPLAVSS
jgi:hypothetical protein